MCRASREAGEHAASDKTAAAKQHRAMGFKTRLGVRIKEELFHSTRQTSRAPGSGIHLKLESWTKVSYRRSKTGTGK
jgi:hypothetical protein